MQWLTAILAFAMTMLIFAVVVTTIVETIHRAFGSRTIGLKLMLRHFYERVLKQHLSVGDPELDRDKFVEIMTLVRAPAVEPTDKSDGNPANGEATESCEFAKLTRWSFKLLSRLPTETFMERLGSSEFSAAVKTKSDDDKKSLLKDIAQKYETFGLESSVHFESKARLISIAVAMFVAWIFYVHPYDLMQTYLKNPEVAERVAALADEPMEKYEELVKAEEKLRKEQSQDQTAKSPLTSDELDEFVKKLREELKAAKVEVGKLSKAGAPVGWPAENVGKFGWIYYPESPKDIFWLLMGGLLTGLGAPFWAKLIGQITQAQSVSKNITNILKPQSQMQPSAKQSVAATDENPVTSDAFLVAASARELATHNSGTFDKK